MRNCWTPPFVLIVVLLAACSSGSSTAEDTLTGVCRNSSTDAGVEVMCAEESASGRTAADHLRFTRENCESRGGRWTTGACDTAAVLGKCRAVQDTGAMYAVSVIYISPDGFLFKTAQDVEKFCQNTGLEFVP